MSALVAATFAKAAWSVWVIRLVSPYIPSPGIWPNENWIQ